MSSPRASHNSAGLPSCNAARYLAISSTAEVCASAPAAANAITDETTATRAGARQRDIVMPSSKVDCAGAAPGARSCADCVVGILPIAQSSFSRILQALGDGRFVGALVAAVVDPCDLHLVALGAALELERQERVLRHRRTPLRGQHGLAVPSRRHVLDVPRRDGLALRVLALAGFHLVVHQHLHLRRVADDVGANSHRICHCSLPYPPQPPSVTFTSFDAM